MTWDPTPWAVNGARHSADVARLLAYAASGNARGVITPGDLKVRQTTVAGNRVVVGPGAAFIPNTYAQAFQQTYVARNPSDDTSPEIAATSTSPRSDLVVVRVEDRQFEGQPLTPEEALDFQYVRTEIIRGVPANTRSALSLNLSYPAYELARIDIPANTGAITNAMIVDLRKLARPRTERIVQYEQVMPNDQHLSASGGNWAQWPNTEPYFLIPEWATEMYVQFSVMGAAIITGAVEGWLRVGLGTLGGATHFYGANQFFAYAAPPASNSGRDNIAVAARFDIPAAHRGQYRVLRLFGYRTVTAGRLSTHNGTQAHVDIQFYERAV